MTIHAFATKVAIDDLPPIDQGVITRDGQLRITNVEVNYRSITATYGPVPWIGTAIEVSGIAPRSVVDNQ